MELHFLTRLLSFAALTSAQRTAFVDVSVATLWTKSTSPRSIDAPALTNPAQIQRWVSGLSTEDSLGLSSGNLDQTQALLGTPVTMLNQTDDGKWLEIAASGQPTPKNAAGYPGFVPAVQLVFDDTYQALQKDLSNILVTSHTATLYRDPALQDPIMDISANTRLPSILRTPDSVAVAIPGKKVAYLSPKDVVETNDVKYPSGADLVATGKKFLGVPYLWGGMSAYGLDCSGFTHTIYALHGITIARDAGEQATFAPYSGRPVARDELLAGDLIFYATNVSDADTIHHVTMYIGDGEMIEAYASGVPVRTAAVREDEYWGAVRVLS